MISCKNICLAANCEKKPTFYANQSRFHGFCDYHFTSTTMEIEFIHCKNCENSIQLTKNLIGANIKEYKASLREYFKQNQATLHKCSESGCESVNTTQLCNSHFICEEHRIIFSADTYCQFCICMKCEARGAYIKNCGVRVCNNCKDDPQCCFVCCKYPSSSQYPSCKHFSCEEHFNSSLMCFCSPCSICQMAQAKVRNCSHLCCESCEIKNYCLYCMSDYCNECSQYKPLYQFECNQHKFCETCYPYDHKCIKCPQCTRCGSQYSNYSPKCKTHPLCDLCSQILDFQDCIYCDDYSKYTCHNCRNTYSNLFLIPDCNHQLCEQCSKFDCVHKNCPLCIPSRDFCISCKPKNYCKKCKILDPQKEISCEHSLCKNCGILENDIHYRCSKCNSAEFFENGKCNKCTYSLCDFCKEYKMIDSFGCNHKICYTCKKRLDIETQEKFSAASCILCRKNSDLYTCSFCILYFKKLESLNCGHKCCEKCILINKRNCELCCICDKCKKIKRNHSLFCNHNICEDCIADQKSDNCPLCQSVDPKINTILRCSLCYIQYNSFSDNYQNSSVCKNHNLCSNCLKKFENFTSCGICSPCAICRDPFCYSSPQNIEQAGKKLCYKVFNIHKGHNECIHCKNKIDSSSDISCEKCKNNSSFSRDFNFENCSRCQINTNCLKRSADSRFYCVNCIILKKIPFQCKHNQNHNCSALLFCDHGSCPLCIKEDKCIDCLSQKSKYSKTVSAEEGSNLIDKIEGNTFIHVESTVEKCKSCNKNNSICHHFYCSECIKTKCDCTCQYCDFRIGLNRFECGHKACKIHSCKSECLPCFKKNFKMSRQKEALKIK